MRKFDNVRMVLFDSTNASFRLAVEAQFTRSNQQGGYRDLVYVTDRSTAMLNPNIYLTLSFKDPQSNPSPVYTSYPQLFRLREALEKVKDLVATGVGYVRAKDGSIAVNAEYAEPIVLADIGKANNWISFKLIVIDSGENGVVTYTPGVAIELSTNNGYTSALSAEEFLTIYTIIKDINLSSLQCAMSLAYLDTNGVGNGVMMPMMNQQPQQYYQPQGGYQQPQQYYQPQGGYQQPQQGYGAPQRNVATPRYGNGGFRNAPRVSQPVAPAPAAQGSDTQMMRPTAPVPPAPTQQRTVQSAPAPRPATKPTINLAAVEETAANESEINYDDSAAIDAIFNEEN